MNRPEGDKPGDAEGQEPDQPPVAQDEPEELIRRIVAELAAVGPTGWRSVDAVFAATVGVDAAWVVFNDGERSVQVEPPESVRELVRQHRTEVAGRLEGPWWRLLLWSTDTGEQQANFDYGEEPFPAEHMFPPEAYRSDIDAFPRSRLPVWLAAYIGHDGRQQRDPRQAVAAARADRAADRTPVLMEHELPEFPVMWARWAVLSAAFTAVGSQWGPRILPSTGTFESSRRSGSTLCMLPGGRAVLSGGVWNAPALDAAYNDAEPLPNLYAGAPDWVADPVLDPRAATGLLSFCYWWDGGQWYRGESPSAEGSGRAVPGVWTADTVVDIVTGLIADRADESSRRAVDSLVSAAQVGVVTRDTVANVFGDDGRYDIDGAAYQLSLAGLVATAPQRISTEDAVARVRDYILDRGLDTKGYPLAALKADRFNVGWMVYVPVPRGEIAIGRAIFYVADDGVLEHSTSSIAPSIFIAGFEERFRRRQGSPS